MTKHIVHTVKVEQQMIIKIAVQRKESVQGSSDHASLVHQTKQLAKHTESPERQHIDKVMCQLCYTGRIQQPKSSRKTVWSFKLQNIDRVVDSSVNMQRSVRTVQRTVEGAQVHQNDEFVDVPVAVHVETARVPPRFSYLKVPATQEA